MNQTSNFSKIAFCWIPSRNFNRVSPTIFLQQHLHATFAIRIVSAFGRKIWRAGEQMADAIKRHRTNNPTHKEKQQHLNQNHAACFCFFARWQVPRSRLWRRRRQTSSLGRRLGRQRDGPTCQKNRYTTQSLKFFLQDGGSGKGVSWFSFPPLRIARR